MKYQPERALTHLKNKFQFRGFICNNEVKARKGIDTPPQKFLPLQKDFRNNEGSQRGQ